MKTRSLILAALLIIALAAPAGADSVTLAPTDDMYTDPYNPGTPPDTTILWVGNFVGGCGTHREQIMVRFDLSELEGATIEEATLDLYRWWRCPNDYYTSTGLYVITEDWDEDTWPYTVYIARETTPSVMYTFGPHLGWYDIDVTDVVQNWVDGQMDNYGLVVIAQYGEKCSKFYSKEFVNPNMHPRLEVTYAGTGVDEEPLSVAHVTATSYPNPFNPITTIRYMLPAQSQATLRIYDTRGRLVRELFDSVSSAGDHEAVWDGSDDRGRSAPSGVYFYVLDTGLGHAKGSMVLVK